MFPKKSTQPEILMGVNRQNYMNTEIEVVKQELSYRQAVRILEISYDLNLRDHQPTPYSPLKDKSLQDYYSSLHIHENLLLLGMVIFHLQPRLPIMEPLLMREYLKGSKFKLKNSLSKKR